MNGFQDLGDFDRYVRAFYFIVTTITTVGFGDITVHNTAEQLFCIWVMILGVVAFSFATGALSSILQNLDTTQAKFREQLEMLDMIKSEYNIGPVFYEELRQSLMYETEKGMLNLIIIIVLLVSCF